MARPLIDLTGMRFGSWLVLRRSPQNYECDGGMHTTPMWICKCDCGEYGVIQGGALRSGNSTCCHKCRDEKRLAGLRESRRIKSAYRRRFIYD